MRKSLGICILALGGSLTQAQLAQTGQWGPVQDMPLVAIHQHYMTNGKVLLFGRGDLGDYAMVWNPETDTYTSIGSMGVDIFCAGHCLLSDGSILMAGGHVVDGWGLKDTFIYDPYVGSGGTWRRMPNMMQPRWYPTCTTMPDGRVLTVSGSMSLNADMSKNWADEVEVFNPETETWAQYGPDTSTRGYYRFIHVLPNGGLYYAGSTIWYSRLFNPATNSWSDFGTPSNEVYGMSSVSYRPGKILKSGGPKSPTDVSGSTWAAVFDGTVANPVWTTIAPMAFERREHDLTVLPDGKVLCTGGSIVFDNPESSIFEAEMFDPATNTWTTLPRMLTPRSYHSSAFLLRDGRVVVAGGGNGGGRGRSNASQDYMSCEIYSPGYLFKGPRPVIQSFPKVVPYGTTFQVGVNDPNAIAAVNLIAPASVTHGYDQNQRFVPLTFQVQNGKLTVTAPVGGNIAPPGPYMLFAVDANGVPSVGEFITVSEEMPSSGPTAFSTTASYSGTLADLLNVDGATFKLWSAKVRAGLSIPLDLTLVSPRRHISSITVDLQSFCPGFNLQYSVSAQDVETGEWKQIGSGFDTKTTYPKKVVFNQGSKRFVDPATKQIKLRFTWSLNSSVSRQLPILQIDAVRLKVTR